MASRLQITLDAETPVKVRRRADQMGVPVAEYVRRVLAGDLGKGPPKADVTAIFNLGSSHEPSDIARDKDRMIAEAIEWGRRRK